MKKTVEIVELPPFKCDDLHFDAKEIDGYQKTWNFVACEREAGKSTLMWKKIYNAFRNEGKPSIVFRRQIVDITEQYVEDTITLLEKFTGVRLPLQYTKGEIKNGQMDIRLNGEIFVRLIGLSAPLSRLKSMMIKNVKYMMMDEFICNMRLGEKYLNDEPFRIKEIYTTYNRESTKPIKCYFFGNPYSLYNPYFSWLCVPTNKLYPGSLVAGTDYVVQCYQIKTELKEVILKKNPLYKFDDMYKQYAFDGRAIQDRDILLLDEAPKGFKLSYIFKLHSKIIGVYNGLTTDFSLSYFCKLLTNSEYSQKRDVVCFDFGEMANRTVLYANNGQKKYQYLKESIQNRKVAYKDIEVSWLMEEIYNII